MADEVGLAFQGRRVYPLAELKLTTRLESLHLDCGRLHVGAFHFYVDKQAIDHDGLVELFDLATKVIIGTNATYQYKPSRPDYISTATLLAACVILRISRSCLASRVDLHAGEKAYFEAIVALRESSLENNDLSARGAMVLAQLWTSTRVFCRDDGVVDGLSVDIRTRLSMGIVFDCFWWWREEFQGKTNPYQPASKGWCLSSACSIVNLANISTVASLVDFNPGLDLSAQWLDDNQMDLFPTASGVGLVGLQSPFFAA